MYMFERSDPGVRVREEQFGEDEAGDGAVEKEIVPLDGGTDGGRDNGAAELHLMFSRRKLKGGHIGRNHGISPGTPLHGTEQRNENSFCKGTPDLLHEFLAFVPPAPGARLIFRK